MSGRKIIDGLHESIAYTKKVEKGRAMNFEYSLNSSEGDEVLYVVHSQDLKLPLALLLRKECVEKCLDAGIKYTEVFEAADALVNYILTGAKPATC